MSGTVHYKFKSALNFSSIAFDGGFISVSDLKKTIAEKSGLASSNDTDLEVSNAQTNEVYRDETFLVPKNTSVLVRRVPAVRKGAMLASSAPRAAAQTERTPSHAVGAEDNFGGDLFDKGGNEDDAIANLVTGTANGWQKEIQASKLRVKGVTEQIMVPSYEDPRAQQKQAHASPEKESEPEQKHSIPVLDVKEAAEVQEFKEKSASPPPPEVLQVLEGTHEKDAESVPVQKQGRQERKEEKQCFNCKEAGHIARECPRAPPSEAGQEGKKRGYGPNGMFPFPVPEAPTDLMNYAFNRSEPLTRAEFEEMQVQGRRMYGEPNRPPPGVPLPPPPPLRPSTSRSVRDVPAGAPSKRRREDTDLSNPPRASEDRSRTARDPSEASLGAGEDERARRPRRRSGDDVDRGVPRRDREGDVVVRGLDRRERRERSRSSDRTRGRLRGEPLDLRDTLSVRRRGGGSAGSWDRGSRADPPPPPPPPSSTYRGVRTWDDRGSVRDRPPSPLRRGGHRIVWKPRT
eukprot:jgi/Pico_ML_1/52639/g3317.t1